MPGAMHRLVCGVIPKPSLFASLTLGLLLTTVLGNGCGPFARLKLAQPRPGGGQRVLRLESDRARFATEDGPWDRLLLAWPLPGARTGGERFVLYLRLPPGGGEFCTERTDDGRGDLAGFLIQRTGHRAGLSRVRQGSVSVTGGAERRTGRLELECADGTALRGSFRAVRSDLALRFFEEDHAADVEALGRPGQGKTADAPAGRRAKQ